MARIKKKGTTGAAKNFITRTQAVRKLQISLPDFRRLCIFKGIYPREPRNKKKAGKGSTPSTTFYYTRDIQYLLHEPLLNKFREHKTLAKKIGRALGRGEAGDAARLERTQKPRITLDHIIKERYPTFTDALRDLDDALSMLYLFANLPSSMNIPPKTINLCQRLSLEFEHYLITTHSLRKSFLSIKGIYYQANIQGQDILWLVPYKFVQRITNDIDLRIMGTFVEFYTTLIGFVNYRLYTSAGLVYPPKFDANSADQGAELSAVHLQRQEIGTPRQQLGNERQDHPEEGLESRSNASRAEAAATAIITEDPIQQTSSDQDDDTNPTSDALNVSTIDTFTSTDPTADILPQPDFSSTTAPHLFAPYTFYLSRETPRAPLEFILRAFGCGRVGWPSILGNGAFTTDENDPRITHQVVDRPPVPVSVGEDAGHETNDGPPLEGKVAANHGTTASFAAGTRMPGRTYIQPQWVWDSINEGRLLRPDLYAPGTTLPPHLSPWVKPKSGEYDPRAPVEEDDLDGRIVANADVNENVDILEDGEGLIQKHDDNNVDGLIEDTNLSEDADVTSDEGENENGWGGFSGGEASDSETENVATLDASKTAPKSILKKATSGTDNGREDTNRRLAATKKRNEKEAAEDLERRKMMLPRRKRKLYEKMTYSNARRDEETEKLKAKRRKLAEGGKASIR